MSVPVPSNPVAKVGSPNAPLQGSLSNWQTGRAFAKLRWRAVFATLRGGGRAAVIEVIATFVLLLIGAVVGLALFAGLRVASPGTNTTAGLVGGSALLIAATTGFATIVGVNNSLDIRVLATEPLTGFQRAIGQLAMAMVGPTGIAMILVGIGTAGGVVRSVTSVPLIVSAVLILLTFNLLLARVVINLLGVLAVRWPRLGQLVSAFAGLTIMVGYQLAANVLPDLSAKRLRSITDVVGWLPGASIGRTLGGAAGGGVGTGSDWGYLLWTAIWLPILVWLFARSTELLTVATAGGRQKTVRDRSGWRRWFGSGPAGTVATRTAITTVRSPRRIVELIMGAAVAGASVVVPPILASEFDSNAVAGVATITGFGACFTAIMAMSNMFGADGPALAHEFLAGITTRDMVRGKRRIAVAVGVPVAVIGVLIVAIVTGDWIELPINLAVASAGVFGGSAVALLQSSWAPFAAPDDANPFAFNAGPSGIVPVLIWILALLSLIVAMAPVLFALGFSASSGSLVWTAVAATLSIPWAYGISRVAEGLCRTHLTGNEARLIDQITRS